MIPERHLISMVALNVLVWTTLWIARGNPFYAFMCGVALASLVFMTVWSFVEKRRRASHLALRRVPLRRKQFR